MYIPGNDPPYITFSKEPRKYLGKRSRRAQKRIKEMKKLVKDSVTDSYLLYDPDGNFLWKSKNMPDK